MQNIHPWYASKRLGCSKLWTEIASVMRSILLNSKWLIGNGNSTSFWYDNWFADCPLIEFALESPEDSPNVAEFFDPNGEWILSSSFLPQAVLDSIAESQICLSNKDDKADSKGRFSLISCWNLIRIKLMPKTWSDVIWKAAVPPKISFFMWKLFHDAILIDSQISQCGVQLASCCNCCTSSKCEDINHLLVDSELANYIWHSMSRIF